MCGLQVLAVAVNSGLVAYPVGFESGWSSQDITVWQPKPPKGYLALGCLVSSGSEAPPLTSMVCLHYAVAVEAPLGQCLQLSIMRRTTSNTEDSGHMLATQRPSSLNVWCIDNAAATFVLFSSDNAAGSVGTSST